MVTNSQAQSSQAGVSHLLTGKDVAEILNISLAYAYYLMRNGDIATVRIGRSVRVRQEDLDTFIEMSRNTEES